MFYKKIFSALLCGAFVLSLTGCGDDEPAAPEQNSGTEISPDANVPDPTGTIELAMRDEDNGKTWLGSIYIENENFCSYGDVKFAGLGAVRGLGNVVNIPIVGWTTKVKVTPGNGYVAYDAYSDKYYRIFVTDYIVNTSGGIIGADVKYQEPFGGADEDIQLTETAISFGEEGGSQALFFNNKHLLVFSAKSNVDWCKVERATTYDVPFLYNGIVITVDKQVMDAEQATVTLTTAYGRKKTITVSYAGYEPYFTLGDMTGLENVPYEGGEYKIGISSNCLEETEIYSYESWISASVVNESAEMHQKAAKLKYIEGKPLTRGQSYDSANDVYTLQVNIPKNDVNYKRDGNIMVRTPISNDSYMVVQDFERYIRATGDVEAEVESGTSGNLYLGYETSYLDSDLTLEYDFGTDEEWFSAYITSRRVRVYNFKANPSENERTVTVTVKSYDGAASLTYTIKQKGKEVYISINGLYDGAYYADRKAATYSLKVDTNIGEGLSFSSSDTEACTVTYTAGNVVLRMKDASENRTIAITCSNPNGSFTVHQSKYAVGDTYNEGAVEGKVYKMEYGKGYIYKLLDGSYAWSTEQILTGCGRDGKVNMDIIRSFPDWQTLYPAFAAVDALNTDGVTGWYLPGIDDVRLLKNGSLWSSTEADSDHAYYCYYSGSYFDSTHVKGISFNVAAVNEFTY